MCRRWADENVTDVVHSGSPQQFGSTQIMISVLVAHSYFLRFDQKQLERAKPYPPLATLQVAGMLRAAGHRVHLFDSMLAQGADEYGRELERAQPTLALFYEDNYNYLSKMCLGRMRQATFEMMARARKHGARVIAAGSDASDAPQEYLAAGADVVLIGEGLGALRMLVARLEAQPSIDTAAWVESVPGIVAIVARELRRSAHASIGPDKEQPALPAWDLVDIDRYRSVWLQAHGYFSLNVAASRGCSFRCSWCAKPIWGNAYLQRTAEEVAQELTFLKERFRPDHIWFADDIFGFRVDWVRRFAAELERLGGRLPFTIQTRADLLSVAMTEALREAGCREVWIGAESGSQRILDSMNKGTTVDEIRTARTRLQERGIRAGFFIQLGYLGEELEDILATRELVEQALPDDIGVSVSYPLPGTKFYEAVKQQLRSKTHWEESNDLAMMFEGTYCSEFYRQVRDLLHEQVSIQAVRHERPAEFETMRRSIQERWSVLLAREQQYRTANGTVRQTILASSPA